MEYCGFAAFPNKTDKTSYPTSYSSSSSSCCCGYSFAPCHGPAFCIAPALYCCPLYCFLKISLPDKQAVMSIVLHTPLCHFKHCFKWFDISPSGLLKRQIALPQSKHWELGLPQTTEQLLPTPNNFLHLHPEGTQGSCPMCIYSLV